MPDVQLAIKPHPAETPDVYADGRGRSPNVRVLPAAPPLAPLLPRAPRRRHRQFDRRASTPLALGMPALVIGLPNNLTPFVDAGVMAGAATDGEIAAGAAPNPV